MLDFVTVVYAQELDLLHLQARSFDVFVSDKDVNAIYAVINDHDDVAESIDVSWYGRHAPKVQILKLSDIDYHLNESLSGWYTQQLCKLLAASKARQTWCCVLDAKMYFIQPFDISRVISADGRARFESYDVTDEWRVGAGLIKLLLKIDDFKIIQGAPFYMHTDTVRELLSYIQEQFKQPLQPFFERFVSWPVMLTEYVLYSAFVNKHHGSQDILYTGESDSLNLNLTDDELDRFYSWISYLGYTDKVTTASIKKSTLGLLSDKQRLRYEKFLRTKGLIG